MLFYIEREALKTSLSDARSWQSVLLHMTHVAQHGWLLHRTPPVTLKSTTPDPAHLPDSFCQQQN